VRVATQEADWDDENRRRNFMCDYSLMGVPNRLARDGEDLVVYEFRTGSRGLTPGTSVTHTQTRYEGFGIVKRLFGKLEPERVAVCIPPGARLLLSDISEDVQKSFSVGASEEVTFTQLTATPNRYRDAVRFKNDREILLQRLTEGQRVRVLQLSLVEKAIRSAPEMTSV
jgi:hypothetical protein